MSAEALASQLEADANYRVLRRVPPVELWPMRPASDVVRGVVIDCETTGLELDDEPIELSVIPFSYCKETGNINAVHVDQALSSFCEPRKAISPESEKIHGISQEMVAGHVIADAQVAAAVGDAKIVIAHNARFDRGMTGKTWPLLDTLCWGCSWNDMNWRERGFDSGALSPVLMKLGYFFDGHRAYDDALATLFLLTQPGVLPSLLQAVRQPLYKVSLRGAPYSCKDAIKARGGYSWDDKHPAGKAWWKCVSEADVAAETVWAQTFCKPDIIRVPLTARHSSRLVEL